MSRDLKAADHKSGGWWNWHPNKTALEYFWHTGKLAIAGRQNFQKIYDLAERVIPGAFLRARGQPRGLRRLGLPQRAERLGFATHGEIAAFWNLLSPDEAKAWVSKHRDELAEVLIEPAIGGKPRPS